MKEYLNAASKKWINGRFRRRMVAVWKWIFLLQTLTPSIDRTFVFCGRNIRHFSHSYNINFPPFRMTERSVELALVDLFIELHSGKTLLEVGAVTPYYWPGRIKHVVDPYDDHPLVTDRQDWLDHDFNYDAIVSISTFEHIGLDDYGLVSDGRRGKAAVEKLLEGGSDFLVTWPGGYNNNLDRLIFDKLRDRSDVDLFVWHRGKRGNNWKVVSNPNCLSLPLEYGPFWANTLIAIHRGPALVS